MIHIPAIPLNQSTALQSKRGRKSESHKAGGFAEYIEESKDTSAPSSARPVCGIDSASSLLGLQEISDDSIATKRAIRHGEATLDLLETLRFALLGGGVPVSMLDEIDALVSQQRQQVSDPDLQELLDEIDVRAAVERAKLEMAAEPRT